MTYIELINRFWKIRRENPITAYESDLYFYLLKECNERNWENPFSASTTVISAELGISRKTIADLRGRLKDKGLIDFREGKQGCSMPSYTIITKVKNTRRKTIIPKEATNKNTANTVKARKKKEPKSLDELFKPEKIKKRIKKEFEPPTFEEVKKYFQDHQANSDQAELFFNYYDSLGWKTATGAKIEKWDSKANVWILNDKNGKHKNETVRESRGNNRGNDSEYKKKLTSEAEEYDRKFREEHGL